MLLDKSVCCVIDRNARGLTGAKADAVAIIMIAVKLDKTDFILITVKLVIVKIELIIIKRCSSLRWLNDVDE